MKTPLLFKRLSISRMAGLPGGLVLDDLSPGINIVHGPNGVGKSRTAWALNLAIWPTALKAQPDAVEALLELEGEGWSVAVDADALRYQRNGADAPPPLLPAAELRDRYNLPLQDLLSGQDEAFARAVLRESVGGVDLKAVVEELKLKDSATRFGRASDDLRQAIAAVRQAEAKHLDLHRDEQELEALARQKEAALDAAARAQVLRKALACADAAERQRQAQSRAQAFNPALAKLAGNELEILAHLRQQLQQSREQADEARANIAQAQADCAASALSQSDLDETLVPSLSAQVQHLKELQALLLSADTAIAAAAAQRNKALANLGGTISPEKLSSLDVHALGDLAEFARQAELVRANAQAVRAVGDWIGQANPSAELPNLQEGLSLLQRWLRLPPPPATPQRGAVLLPLAAAVIVLLAGLLAVLIRWPFILFTVPAIGLLVAWQRLRPVPAQDLRPFIAAEFLKLKLGQPATWTDSDVESLCSQLSDALAQARLEKQKADRFADLAGRRAELEEKIKELTHRAQDLAARLGVLPQTDESALYILVQNISRFQEADAALAAAQAQRDRLSQEHQHLRAQLVAALQRYGYGATDPADLSASIEELRARQQHHRLAQQRIEAQHRLLAGAESASAQASQRLDALFANLGFSSDDEPALKRLLAERRRYLEAQEQLTIATHDLESAQALLAHQPDLQQRSRRELEDQLRQAEQDAAELEHLNERSAGIKKAIELAKQASDLEAALARRQECLETVRQLRQRDCDALAGFLLAEHLRQATRDRHRPAVFRRARELFARITQGRYQLEFDNADLPAFLAIDTSTGIGLGLQQLSSGTRLQLLLCVRVAFVEEQEQGLMLPLFLDETLGNSDELRARAIIDATIEISRSGRQIFYFTAQSDEVGKWRQVLAHTPDVSHKLIDLAALRGLAERQPLPDSPTPPRLLIPSPQGLSRDEYGRLLSVPAFDPRNPEIGAIHLWHLLDDIELLHRLLSLGIKTWGQWRTLAAHGGLPPSPQEQAAFQKAEARARFLDHAARQWRIGRGKPLDRQTILECDAVTELFREPLVALAASVGGDAGQFMARLEAKAVPRFRQTAIAALKNHLLERGYLDEQRPLDAQELRTRALALAMPALQAGLLSIEQIDAYLATSLSTDPPHAPPCD